MRHSLIAASFLFLMLSWPASAGDNVIQSCSDGKVTLDVEGMNIHTFLLAFADESQLHLAVRGSRRLRGRVSLKLECVDARLALRLALGQVSASYCVENDLLMIYRGHGSCPEPQPDVKLIARRD